MPTIGADAYDIQYSDPVDDVASALASHHGDVRATIETLLRDIRFLKQQLAITQIGMSVGFTRGWQPSFERDATEENNHA